MDNIAAPHINPTFIIQQLCAGLPKAELHLHLRGAMQQKTLTQLIKKYSVQKIWDKMPIKYKILFNTSPHIREFVKQSNHDIAKIYNFKSFKQFLIHYCFLSFFIREREDLQLLINDVVTSLKNQNIVYVEIMIGLIEYLWKGLTFDDFSYCFDQASKIPGIKIQWIVDLVRDTRPKKAYSLLKEIIAWKDKNVVGITLGGSEQLFPAKRFKKVYSLAKSAGLKLTIHAGEVCGPQSVWDSIKLLGVERIGHGVQSIKDPKLVEYLSVNKIPLEICITSNIKTKVYSSYKAHPIKKLYEAGIPITINSDDPAFFDTNLNNEYNILQNLGFSNNEIIELVENGFRYAFLPEATINSYLRNLRNVINKEKHIKEK
ncbi:adenosine deaminase [candidate division WOR-3 bacterium]|nr:adenosine deaminase [candidate division WOR-3 bacterium]